MHSINMALHVFCIIHIIFAQIKATNINHVEGNNTGFAYSVFKKKPDSETNPEFISAQCSE